MKRTSLFLIFSLLAGMFGYAQQGEGPTELKPIYFDVSPPLRDMVANHKPKDNSWKDGVVKNYFNSSNQSNNDQKATDPSIQNFYGQVDTDTTILNFDGTGNIGGEIPPDTYGDVGPNHYFQIVNTYFAIYDKSGTKLLGPSQTSTIWQGLPHNNNQGDGVVVYDEQADRWLVSQFDLGPNYTGPFYENIGISQTPDPTGSWYRYQYQLTYNPDYPKYAVWGDGYYMSAHAFTAAGNYTGLYGACFNRTKMLAGDPTANMVMFLKSSSSPGFGFLPSDCDGPFPPSGTPCFYVYRTVPSTLGMYEFHVDWNNTSNSTFNQSTNLGVNSFSVNTNKQVVPQPGTSVKLDGMEDRMMYRAQYRQFAGYGSLVCNHTVTASGVAGIRWYELRRTGSTWSVYQQSTYAPDNKYRWMGSIAQDSSGNIALGFSISSSSFYPSVHYTGRMAGDPLNTMTVAEKTIINGNGSQLYVYDQRARWGDYSGMTVDPEQVFWYTQEYYQTTGQMNWSTRIASFYLGDALIINASATPALICLGDSSQLNVTASGGSGNYSYSWTSIPPGFTSTLQNPWVKPVVSTQYVIVVSDGTNSRTDTVNVAVDFEPTFSAGNDSTWCFPVTKIQVNGYAHNYSHIEWSTLGDGTFNNDTIQKPLYTLGANDKSTRHITLVMTVYPGNYPYGPCTVVGTDSLYVTLDWCNGIEEQKGNDFNLSVVPNPSHESVTLTVTGISNSKVELLVSDMQGKTIFSDNLSGSTASRKIDVSGYPKGIYLVRAKSDGHLKIEKLIIN